MNAEFEMMQHKYPSVHYWQPGGMEFAFCNEPGEEAGVRENFFTAIAEVREGVPLCRCNMYNTICLLHVESVACMHTYLCCIVVLMSSIVVGCPIPGEPNASYPGHNLKVHSHWCMQMLNVCVGEGRGWGGCYTDQLLLLNLQITITVL